MWRRSACTVDRASADYPAMGFNKRKMEDRRRLAAEKEAAARRATEKQILEDVDHLITVWNERQGKRMPMLFSPTIGAATAGYWFLRACCPACRTTGDVDLRALDWHRGAAVTALIPALSCPGPIRRSPSFVSLRPLSPTKCAKSTGADCGSRRVQDRHEDYNDTLPSHGLAGGCHRARQEREPRLLRMGFIPGNPGNPR
jgi:hypothetical protein